MTLQMRLVRALTIAAACLVLVFAASNALAQCRFADAPSATTWTYRFQTEFSPDGLVLHVTVELPLGGDGRTSLQLPAHWAGETLHSLSNLRALSEAKLEVDPKGDAAELYGPPNGVATIAYDLEKDWTVRSFIRCSSIRSDVRQHGIEPRTRERSGHHVAKRHYAHHLN